MSHLHFLESREYKIVFKLSFKHLAVLTNKMLLDELRAASPLHNLDLVHQRGMRANHSVAYLRFELLCAICELVVAVRLGHLGATALAFPVIRMLLAGGTPEAFVHLVVIVGHGGSAVARGRVAQRPDGTRWP